MRARFYNPYLCRFLSADPAGFSGGLNFYAYADGNPVTMIDPFGLGADSADGTSSPLLRPQTPVGGYVDAFGNWHPTFCYSCHDPTDPAAKFYKDQSTLANLLDWKVIAYQQALGAALTFGVGAIAEDMAAMQQMQQLKQLQQLQQASKLGSLTPSQVRQIQAFVDRFEVEVNVVGSRAAGTAGPSSDFDYVIGGNASLRHSAERFLPRNPQSVTGSEAGNLPFRGIDVFNANKTPLDPTRPFIQFTPGQAPVVGPR